jgi:hypothetical protein
MRTLEHVCQEQQLFYRVEHGKLSVFATGRYPESSHVVRIGLLQNSKIGILIEFAVCKEKSIEQVETFCSAVGEMLPSGISVAFDDIGGRFFLYDTVEAEKLASHLAVVSRECDVLKPLFESVGRAGHWRHALYLAFASPKDVSQWPRA